MILLQLIGNQAWPNLLPALALRPDLILGLVSANSDSRNKLGDLRKASLALGLECSWQALETASENPTFNECLAALESVNFDAANLTGGSKPMSLAAFERAKALDATAFYLDTRRTEPVEILRGMPLITTETLRDAQRSVTIPAALLAHRMPTRGQTEPKVPDRAQIDFARRAADLRADPGSDDMIGKAFAELRESIHPAGRRLKGNALKQVALAPIPGQDVPVVNQYLQAAHECGLLAAAEAEGFSLLSAEESAQSAKAAGRLVEKRLKTLQGLWFETFLYDQLAADPDYGEIAWSIEAEPGSGSEVATLGETDLIAIHLPTGNLEVISCKLDGPHGSNVDHLEGLKQRAGAIAGKFARPRLAVFRMASAEKERALQEQCPASGVTFAAAHAYPSSVHASPAD